MLNKGAAILAASALFVSGLAIGALGVHLFYAEKMADVGAPPMPVGPVFQRWLVRSLDLSPKQRIEVQAVLEASHVEAEGLRREMGPRLERMNQDTAAAISKILSPEQRQRMDELMARRERRQRRFRPGDGPPRGRGHGPRPSPRD